MGWRPATPGRAFHITADLDWFAVAQTVKFPVPQRRRTAAVQTITLPASPAAFADAGWPDIAPYYEGLATAPLSRDNVEEWLKSWSQLEELIDEAGTMAMIAYTGDTADAEKEKAHLRFSTEIFPQAHEQGVRLSKRLLHLDYSRPGLETTVQRFRTDAEIFREENVALFAELEELSAQYQKIVGGLTAQWEGETKTIPQLQPYLKERDRQVRERAWRLGNEAYLAHRDELAALFDKMFIARTKVAGNAGFPNYQEYAFKSKHRFDYTPADCERFHDAVEKTVVPAVARQLEYRRERLGLDRIRPWDLGVELERVESLKPFDDVAVFVDRAKSIFRRVDPKLGSEFALMAADGLLDLESRQGKAPGGYCTKLSFRGKPFIFMNAVGVADDVNTLVHEAGHSFHDFAAHTQPLIWQRSPGHEAAELASMSMELLASPYLQKPDGYYTADEARSAQIEHLEDILFSLPHISSVDAFQSWIYTSGEGHDAAARDRAWLDIRSRFERGIDWSGLEQERVARWYRQLHIFEYPFYYIEYGIAQMGALQVWRHSLADQSTAVKHYREALALGGTVGLPEIYQAAGARLVFDAETMGELVDLVEKRLTQLRAA
jgi:oligoendopeptidase F